MLLNSLQHKFTNTLLLCLHDTWEIPSIALARQWPDFSGACKHHSATINGLIGAVKFQLNYLNNSIVQWLDNACARVPVHNHFMWKKFKNRSWKWLPIWQLHWGIVQWSLITRFTCQVSLRHRFALCTLHSDWLKKSLRFFSTCASITLQFNMYTYLKQLAKLYITYVQILLQFRIFLKPITSTKTLWTDITVLQHKRPWHIGV